MFSHWVFAIVLVVFTLAAVFVAARQFLSFFPAPSRISRRVPPDRFDVSRLRLAEERRQRRNATRLVNWSLNWFRNGTGGHYWLREDGTPNAKLRERNAWQAAHA